MSGIAQRLNQAKREKWPSNEVQLLNKLRYEANQELTHLLDVKGKTAIGARQNAKSQINQAQLSINAFNHFHQSI